MWNYAKQLEYPVCIRNREPRLAKVIISQYGGPDRRACGIAKVFITKIFYARSKSNSHIERYSEQKNLRIWK